MPTVPGGINPQGTNLNQTDAGCAKASFSCAASVAAAAEQAVPPFFGAASTLTSFPGVQCAFPNVVRQLNVSLVGDVLNVGGQTIGVKLYRALAATPDVKVAVPDAEISGIATTANAKSATVAFPDLALAPGDVLYATITPSALLTAVVTNVAIGVG